MPDKTTLPNSDQVSKIVVCLFGDDALVKQSSTPIPLTDKNVIAKYVDDDSNISRLVLCDLPFANNAGAALTMISPGVVADAIKDKELPDNILDNFREVMNIFVNLFAETTSQHLVLNDISVVSNDADEPTTKALNEPVERIDFEVNVPRYGNGRIALLAC